MNTPTNDIYDFDYAMCMNERGRDAFYAGTENAKKCTLILTEDEYETFMTTQLSHLSEEELKYIGIMSLKGYLDYGTVNFVDSHTYCLIRQYMGLKHGVDSGINLRYGKIEYDGKHLEDGYVINTLRIHWPILTKMSVFLSSYERVSVQKPDNEMCRKLVSNYLREYKLHNDQSKYMYNRYNIYNNDNYNGSFFITDSDHVDYMNWLMKFPNDFIFEKLESKYVEITGYPPQDNNEHYTMTFKNIETPGWWMQLLWVYAYPCLPDEEPCNVFTNKLLINMNTKTKTWQFMPCKSDSLMKFFSPSDDNIIGNLRGQFIHLNKDEYRYKQLIIEFLKATKLDGRT